MTILVSIEVTDTSLKMIYQKTENKLTGVENCSKASKILLAVELIPVVVVVRQGLTAGRIARLGE